VFVTTTRRMRMGAVKLQDWSCWSDPYAAPEIRTTCLVGRVYGHHREPDGKKVKTSRIVDADGRLVTTSSGTVYRLGRIDPKYRRWLRKEGREYDPGRPILIKDRGETV
jgi:hypothetical protein